MNKLKKYAGLLNEEAPENHFLAYITPSERDMLVDAGGKETSTASGIFAYPPPGEKGGGGYMGSSEDKTTSSTGDYTFSGGSNQETNRERAIRAAATTGSSYTGGVGDPDPPHEYIGNEKVYIGDDKVIVGIKDKKPIQTHKDTSWFDNIKNYILSGGIIGQAIELTGEVLSKLGEHSSELQKKAMTMSLNSRVKRKMKTLDLNNPNSMNNPVIADLQKDLANIEAGTFTQTDFTEKYGSGDLGGEGEGGDRELMNTFVPYAAHAVGGTTPQSSMVNEYFSNLNNTSLGISPNYLSTYNTAKSNIANTLNMTPNTQQYGYTANPYSQYPSTMTSANPFFDELTTQGLI